ncbi:hypothetical protein ABER23_16820 [Paenibacillus lautus]|uniref:hypothetical protein n=1 Tax=Paenibacillus lautus TaxID=1401 RepID=UPI003D2C41DF
MTGYSRFQGLTSLLGLIYFLDMPVMDKSKMSTKQGAARVGLAVQTRNKKKTGSQDPALFKCAVGAWLQRNEIIFAEARSQG